MTRIREIGSDGIAPRQHFDPANFDQQYRLVTYSCRLGPETEEGRWDVVAGTVGDDLGWNLWRPIQGERKLAGWSQCWSAIVSDAQQAVRPQQGRTTTGPAQPAVQRFRPDTGYARPDPRFQQKAFGSAYEPWHSKFPVGWLGTVNSGTSESEETDVWHPDFLGLVSDMRGGGDFSTQVVDLFADSGTINPDTAAPLHTGLITQEVVGSRADGPTIGHYLSYNMRHAAPWGGGGLISYGTNDTALAQRKKVTFGDGQGASAVLCMSHLFGGPFALPHAFAPGRFGEGRRDYIVGQTRDGDPVLPLAMATQTLWRGANNTGPIEGWLDGGFDNRDWNDGFLVWQGNHWRIKVDSGFAAIDPFIPEPPGVPGRTRERGPGGGGPGGGGPGGGGPGGGGPGGGGPGGGPIGRGPGGGGGGPIGGSPIPPGQGRWGRPAEPDQDGQVPDDPDDPAEPVDPDADLYDEDGNLKPGKEPIRRARERIRGRRARQRALQDDLNERASTAYSFDGEYGETIDPNDETGDEGGDIVFFNPGSDDVVLVGGELIDGVPRIGGGSRIEPDGSGGSILIDPGGEVIHLPAGPLMGMALTVPLPLVNYVAPQPVAVAAGLGFMAQPTQAGQPDPRGNVPPQLTGSQPLCGHFYGWGSGTGTYLGFDYAQPPGAGGRTRGGQGAGPPVAADGGVIFLPGGGTLHDYTSGGGSWTGNPRYMVFPPDCTSIALCDLAIGENAQPATDAFGGIKSGCVIGYDSTADALDFDMVGADGSAGRTFSFLPSGRLDADYLGFTPIADPAENNTLWVNSAASPTELVFTDSTGTNVTLGTPDLNDISFEDGGTSDIQDVLDVIRTSTGTVANGFGSNLTTQLENAAGATTDAFQIQTRWITASGSTVAGVRFRVNDGGSLITAFEIVGNNVSSPSNTPTFRLRQGYLDWTEGSNPGSNPSSGDRRLWITSGGLYTVRDSSGNDKIVQYTCLDVEANTAVAASPNALTASESGKVLTNEGATAENHHDLPAAAAGLTYTFVVQDADGIQVNAQAGDTIRVDGSVSAGGGNIASTTIGDTVTLTAINATEWVAIASLGAGGWTVT